MNFSPFEEMQKAVDVVQTSPHPVNKIAATITGQDHRGRIFSISRTNTWPEPIATRIGTSGEIGNSSGTVHAETNCILSAPITMGAALFITDPFCPNCAKNIAEAGIKNVYIDHKGFQKDFAARRGDVFASMSMRICERAGINVYQVSRKEEKVENIIKTPAGHTPMDDSPVDAERINGAVDRQFFDSIVYNKLKQHHGRRFAVALAHEPESNDTYVLTARTHPAIGYSMETDADAILNPEGKYSLILEPINRLMMNAARRGLKLMDGHIFCTHIPTAREQINMVGGGLGHIQVGDMTKARDEGAFAAMRTLNDSGVLKFTQFD